MSVRCLCFTDFPPRDFQRLRDADEYSSRIRFSTNFMQLDNDGLRFGCRRCGQVWSWTFGDKPPYLWRPEGRTGGEDETKSVEIAELRLRGREPGDRDTKSGEIAEIRLRRRP